MSDNVYIKDLPHGMDGAMIKATFGAYGNVLSCKILPATLPGQKTAALVRFENSAQANWVINNIDGNIPHGLSEPVIVKPSQGGGKGGGDNPYSPYSGRTGMQPAIERPPNDNLFISGLPEGSDDNFVKVIFQEYGIVTQVKMMPPVHGKPYAALVRFDSLASATAVQTSLHGVTPQGFPGPLQIMYAESAEQKAAKTAAAAAASMGQAAGGVAVSRKGAGKARNDIGIEVIVQGFLDSGGLPGATQADVTCVYVGGLPPDCQDKHLYRIFTTFGSVQPKGITMMTDAETGLCAGYAFVNFIDRDVADIAVKTLHGTTLPDGSAMRVIIKEQ